MNYLPAVVLFLGASVGALDMLRPAAAEEPRRQPNVIVILADDVGYGDLGCYGATRVSTPHLDRLVREGRRFSDAHAPSSVCTPTRTRC